MTRSADAALAAERDYLRSARDDLRRMREHTLSLTARGGDPVSEGYLQAALDRRALALVDDPSVPLFFGRIDVGEQRPESFHIGRRHIMNAAGDPVVVDWRADISRAFYRATRHDPHKVTLRRRFGFARGEITSYEDEHLGDAAEADVTSRILTEEIERPRVGPMRDIVATIQPVQDEVVRADLDRTVCVQGAPGTGKTAGPRRGGRPPGHRRRTRRERARAAARPTRRRCTQGRRAPRRGRAPGGVGSCALGIRAPGRPARHPAVAGPSPRCG